MKALFSIISLLIVFGAGAWFVTRSVPLPNDVAAPEGSPTGGSMLDPIEAAKNTKELIESKQSSGDPEAASAQKGVTIDLSGQGLVKVDESVFKRTSTEILDVSKNALSGALQAEVRHLTQLRVLDLSDNQFTGVPAEVGQLSKLEVLDLSNNKLTGLPYELGNLKNLKILDLRGNNYAKADLAIIRQGLSSAVVIRVDE